LNITWSFDDLGSVYKVALIDWHLSNLFIYSQGSWVGYQDFVK
jgi:hypothetical protein